MATTLITLTQQVLEGMGQYRLLDVTTGGSATVATSTHLRRWVGAADVLNDRWFVRFTNLNDTTPSTANRDRLITDSTTSTVTYERATSVNTSTTDPDQFLLLSFDPSFITAAINSAGQYLFHRGMYLPIRDETLFVDNLLSNSSFEDTISHGPMWGVQRLPRRQPMSCSAPKRLGYEGAGVRQGRCTRALITRSLPILAGRQSISKAG